MGNVWIRFSDYKMCGIASNEKNRRGGKGDGIGKVTA